MALVGASVVPQSGGSGVAMTDQRSYVDNGDTQTWFAAMNRTQRLILIALMISAAAMSIVIASMMAARIVAG